MSLAEICGMENFDQQSSISSNSADLTNFCKNFTNNLELGVPPFSNVRTILLKSIHRLNILFLQPAENLSKFTRDENGREIKMHFDHGTTTLGFMYKGGVVLAVDSRATGGQFIGSQTIKKIVEINDFLLATLAGGAADCLYWDRVLAKQCRIYELRNRERISVAAASKLMANMVYNYKGMGLSIGMMLAGWDKRVRTILTWKFLD